MRQLDRSLGKEPNRTSLHLGPTAGCWETKQAWTRRNVEGYRPNARGMVCPSKQITAVTNPRSPDNGLLTPAMKLARPTIAKTFAQGIEKAYGRAL
jgi:hypothetical protein